MTNYEVFHEADPEALARLLTVLACGILGGDVEPEERADIYKTLLDFLMREAG